MNPMRIGIIGCGNISDIYLKNCARFSDLELVACADLIEERAIAKAKEHEVPRACSVNALLADDSIELVVNLTVPKAHVEVDLAVIEAGKHVYSEKPLALSRDEGLRVLERAAAKGVRVGCAPDTFLGAAGQTARKLIDDGWIGEPVSGMAFMLCHGHESWHPDPEFYYEAGGGPMFDMGPYYLTMLVQLLGPVRRVCGFARATFPERIITSQKKRGKHVPVETPTHLADTLEFASGALVTMAVSFDVWKSTLPPIEIHGTTGSMCVPDPNCFGGVVRVFRSGADDWCDTPHSHGYADQSRGVGVADLARAIRTGRPHRASGALAGHVLDVMHAFLEAQDQGRAILMQSACERPAPFPMNLPWGEVE